MLNKYYKYLPWVILGAFWSYQSAIRYAQTTFDFILLNNYFYDCKYSFIVFTRNLFKI